MRVVLTGRLGKSHRSNSHGSTGRDGDPISKIGPTTNSGTGYKNLGRSRYGRFSFEWATKKDSWTGKLNLGCNVTVILNDNHTQQNPRNLYTASTF